MERHANPKSIVKITLLIAVLATCGVSQAKILYVDGSAAGGNVGRSWHDACNYLQDALASALPGDEVRVAQGVYTPNLGEGIKSTDRSAVFQLISGVTITGGYAGMGMPDPDLRDVDIFETILSGNLYGDNEPDDNSYLVVGSTGNDETAVLDGFTITGGIGQGTGGMLIESGGPTINNCTFRNYVSSLGDDPATAVTIADGNCVLTACTFEDNNLALDSANSAVVLNDCTLQGNTGPAINQTGGSLTLDGCSFIDNSAPEGDERTSGCIYNQGGTLTVTDCVFTGNSYPVPFGTPPITYGGAAINSTSGDVDVEDSTFSNNSTSGYGGAIRSPDLVLKNCRFSENLASAGGAVSASQIDVQNCIFEGNVSGLGSALLVDPQTPGAVTNCTFYGNIGANGVIYRAESTNAALAVTGSIITNNNSNSIKGDKVSVTYCDVEGGSDGEGNVDVDPNFVSAGYWADPADNEVPVEPDYPNAVWVMGDYHLMSQAGRWDSESGNWVEDASTSPCIDAGEPNSPIGLEPSPNGGVYNLGAYGRTEEASKTWFSEVEAVCNVVLAGDINGDCIVDSRDLDIVMSQWLLKGEDFVK